jgi:hypothetical protein
MKQRAIRVVKRKDVVEKAWVAAKSIKAAKTPALTNHKIVNAVSRWIFEREENRGEEKSFSDNKILSWEPLPETFEETIS